MYLQIKMRKNTTTSGVLAANMMAMLSKINGPQTETARQLPQSLCRRGRQFFAREPDLSGGGMSHDQPCSISQQADAPQPPRIPYHQITHDFSELRVACDTAHWKPASALTCPESTDYGQPTRNGL